LTISASIFLTILKGTALERPLTILLPVQDAQATLADTVAQVLEMAADMTDRFELVIIDDGSMDATGEVADELTRCYPQVRILRHGRRLGRDAAVRTGLKHCRGDLIFVREPGGMRLQRLAQPNKPSHLSKPARPNFLGRVRQGALEP
jgi:hypothetical protein